MTRSPDSFVKSQALKGCQSRQDDAGSTTDPVLDERLTPASTTRVRWWHEKLQAEQTLFVDPKRGLRRGLQRGQGLDYMRESVAVARSVPASVRLTVRDRQPESDGLGALARLQNLLVARVVHLCVEVSLR